MSSRHFKAPQLNDPFSSKYSEPDYFTICARISEKCWKHYNHSGPPPRGNIFSVKPPELSSIYIGSLGPCCFLRLKHVLHERRLLQWHMDHGKTLLRKDVQKKKESHINHLLRDAIKAADDVTKNHYTTTAHDSICSLLEGGRVSALALKSVLLKLSNKPNESSEINREILSLLRKLTSSLLPSECDVLYGRAGALQVILFLRYYLQEPKLGHELALLIIHDVLVQGETLAEKYPQTKLPLVWEHYEYVYLGAAHGIVGILFTLLHFPEELQHLETHSSFRNKNIVTMIKTSLDAMNANLLLPSGNLASTLGDKRDYLVHWCHGSQGHILLLVKAYEVFQDKKYLDLASKIAENVVFSRGLLKKGVGLCHGISGSAYVFLALHRAEKAAVTRSPSSDNSGYTNQWLYMARYFADFAIDKYSELEHVPDQPYSLFEGAAGLAVLILDITAPTEARFPCYEY